MVSFVSKKIQEQENSLGEKLKVAREMRNESLDNVSARLGINAKYLMAFEQNSFKDLPEGIYADKFLKKYSQYLGVEEAVLMFPIEHKNRQESLYQLSLEKDSPLKKIKNFILSPAVVKNAIFLAVVACGIVYLYSIAYNIVKMPNLSIIHPGDDFVTSSYTVDIKGETDEDTKIFINDKEIFCSQEGVFGEEVDLTNGLNVVKISAKRKYSKENIEYRKILVTGGEELSKK